MDRATGNTASSALKDEEGEALLLGGIILRNEALEEISEILKPKHFSSQLHGRFYSQMLSMRDKGTIISVRSMAFFAAQDKAFENAKDGPAYIAEMERNYLSSLESRADARSFARLSQEAERLRDLWVLREIIKISTNSIESVLSLDRKISPMERAYSMEKDLYSLTSEDRKSSKDIGDILKSSLEKMELDRLNRKGGLSGIGSGFEDIDAILGGFQRSDLIILAARPSMGKTALALNIAVNMAALCDENESVAFFSLEMSADQLATRILAMESRIATHKIKNHKLSVSDIEAMEEAIPKLRKLKMHIDDSPTLSISELRSKARMNKRLKNIQCIFVDYLQLIKGDTKSDNRVQEVSEITMSLKAMAKELDIPVIALSQLSRAVEGREEKKPQLSDLRESGSIEQDADVVMFLYREAYYEQMKKPMEDSPKFLEWQEKMKRISNDADLIIAKHRNGPVGYKKLYFSGITTRFDNYQYTDEHFH